MSIDPQFTKENLNACLSALAKEFRKLNGTKIPAEIILIGGASVLANYGFRQMTYDIDAVISASSVMKEAINRTGDKLGLPNGWLNTDFKTTKSFSDKLAGVSVYYKTFSNVLTVRTVAAQYLVAMKLMSGRQYKNDLSDIVGVLWEHQKRGNPVSYEAVKSAVQTLYGEWSDLPQSSAGFLNDIFKDGDFESVYKKVQENERSARKMLLETNHDAIENADEEDAADILRRAEAIKKGKDYGM